jgi:hypothetical protein
MAVPAPLAGGVGACEACTHLGKRWHAFCSFPELIGDFQPRNLGGSWTANRCHGLISTLDASRLDPGGE